MNPNYPASSDQEPDTTDPNEGSEGELTFSTQDYPELDGLQKGAPITVTCKATVSDAGNGTVTLAIDPGACQFETEGQATKAAKEMSQQSYNQPDQNAGVSGDDF